MAFHASDSAIKVTKSIEEEIASATSTSAIQQILWRVAQEQHLIRPDEMDPSGHDHFSFRQVEPGTAPRSFAKAFMVNGKKVVLESDSEEGLVQEEIKAMHRIFDGAQPAAATQAEIEAEAARVADLERPRNEKGQFITYDPAITALAPTIAAALEAQGISVDELREFSQNRRNDSFQHSWAEATEAFRNSPEGADWAGGKNFEVLTNLLIANPELMDKPSAETLALVWNHMKEHDLVVENPELTARAAIAAATTPEELRTALAAGGYRSADGRDSGVWGR